jgi:hypothetical protein
MPGFKLLTKLDAQTCLKAAWRTAQDLGYELTPIEDCAKRFTATKGSLLLSVLPFGVAPQCVFQIHVEAYPDGNELVLEKNEPWLRGGAIAVGKVTRQAEELLGAIACAIEKAGGAVLERKEF